MKKNCFNDYLKSQLKYNLKSPFYLFISVLFYLFVEINFFIRQQFFTGSGTSDLLLYFSIVPYVSVIVIPALCYKNSASVYDDFVPLKTISRLFAQYLNIVILYSVEILLLIPGALFVNIFGQIDGGQLFTSLVCLILYGACVISICLFLRELIQSKIAALVVSCLILLIFHIAHLGAIYLPVGILISDFLKSISFAWHFDAAGKGILDTRDLLFFICAAVFFILITAGFVENKAGKKSSKKQKTTYSLYILILILTILNSTRWYSRIDLSKNKTFTLSDYTNKLVKKLDDNLKITYYRSSKLSGLYPQIRDVSDFLSYYAGKNKYITYKIVDPDKDSKIIENLKDYGITSQQMRSVTKSSTEYTDVFSAIVLEYKGIIQTVPFIMSADTLEYDLDSKVKFLMNGKYRIINVIVGNGMTLNQDYNYVVPWLNLQGFVVNEIQLQNPQFSFELENTSGPLLVIGDSEIKIENAIAIENYILQEKGNAVFTVSPYSADIENDWSITENKNTNIIEMLENWGVKFLPEINADISCSRIIMYSQNEDDNSFTQESTYTKNLNYPLWINVLPQENTNTGATLFWPDALEISGNAKTYLYSSSAAYSYEIDRNSPDKLIETNPFMLEESNTSGIKKETKILAAEITGPLEGLYNYADCNTSDIIVIPDQYFLNTLMISYNGGENGDFRNYDFITNCLLKLNGENELAEIHGRNQKDNSLYKITDNYSFIKMEMLTFIVLFILIPVLIICFGLCCMIFSTIKSNKKIEKLLEAEDEK